MRVAVVGGKGFYGQSIVEELRSRGHEVVVASRSASGAGEVRVDLTEPRTFAALAEFDVVVNVADSVDAPSTSLLAWAEETGKRVVECSAFAPFYREAHREPEPGRATVVLGAGVFPGYSTALACETAASLEGEVEAIDLGIRISPFSGAGRANCELMTQMLALPGFEYVDGELVERPTVGAVRTFDFPTGRGSAATVDLPDVELIRWATGAPNVTVRIGLMPGFVLPGFRMAALFAKWAGPLRGLVLACTKYYLLFLRAVLLRHRPSPVEFSVECRSGETAISATGRHEDGRAATAAGVAAVVELTGSMGPGRYVAGAELAESRRGRHPGLPTSPRAM